MSQPTRKPWFGPKRIGFGFRPQTWQGWLLTSGLVVVILLIAIIMLH